MSTSAARLKALHNDILQGRSLAALPEIERRARKEPRNPALAALRAEALHRTGRHREAGHAFRSAADLGGDRVYWLAAGTLLAAMGDFDAALDCLKLALAQAPDDPKTLDALIFTLSRANRHGEGVDHARRQLVTSQDPAHLTRAARLLLQTGVIDNSHYAECADALRRADQLSPQSADIWGTALVIANYVCDWDWSDSLRRRILDCYARGDFASPNESAFWNLTWCDEEAFNLGLARTQAGRRRASLSPLAIAVKPLPAAGRRLRVGYLSSDFFDHATMHLMAGVFEHHDRGRFEIFAYDYSRSDDSEFRKRFLTAVEHHVPLDGMTDEQVATRIAANRLDVLIDLKLYTQGQRPNIIAHRPAPLIAAYLGFPGSGGTSDVDYAITDRFVTPDDSAPFWTEKFCRLPHSYQCNDRHRATAPSSGGRAAHGLPEDALVFANFNQSYKMDRGSFTLWMQILTAVPDSVLWLLRPNDVARDHLLRQAQAAGIDPGRILFAPKLHYAHHRARLPLADVVLDTLICNGHTTTSDALWAGVPVVTARGRHFASRVSESLLDAVGLPELAGADADGMAAIAIRLGTDSAYRQSLKQRLNDNRLTTPLFDTARFTRDFETAIQMMVERQRQGLPPDHLDVPDAGPLEPERTSPLPPEVLVRRQRWAPLIGRVIDQLRAHATALPGRPLWIDLGCGSGDLLRTAVDAGFGGIGLDGDETRVERLKQLGCKALFTPDLAAGFLSINFNISASVISLLNPPSGETTPAPERATPPDERTASTAGDFPPCPRPVLEHAFSALHPGGALMLAIDPTDASRRDDLAALLDEIGFDVTAAPETTRPGTNVLLCIRRNSAAATTPPPPVSPRSAAPDAHDLNPQAAPGTAAHN